MYLVELLDIGQVTQISNLGVAHFWEWNVTQLLAQTYVTDLQSAVISIISTSSIDPSMVFRMENWALSISSLLFSICD